MGIRTGQANPALGLQPFNKVLDSTDTQTVAPGTITEGYDDVNNRTDEYIWLISPAAVAAGTEVTYDTTYTGTVVAAGLGQATALNASGAGQRAWFRLKRRGVIA